MHNGLNAVTLLENQTIDGENQHQTLVLGKTWLLDSVPISWRWN
jgi:hypothetical protein